MDSYRRFLDLNAGDAALARRSPAPPGRPESGELRIGAHRARTGHQRGLARDRGDPLVFRPAEDLPEVRAQRLGALPAGARLRAQRAARQGAGVARSAGGELSATAATSTRRSSGAARCCSRTKSYPAAASGLRGRHQDRRRRPHSTTRVSTSMAGPCSSKARASAASNPSPACSIRCWCRSATPKELIEHRHLEPPQSRTGGGHVSRHVHHVLLCGRAENDRRVREAPQAAGRTITCCTRAWAICTSRRSATRTPPTAIAPSSRRTATTRRRRCSRCRPSRLIPRAASRSSCCRARRNSSRTTATARRTGRGGRRRASPKWWPSSRPI